MIPINQTLFTSIALDEASRLFVVPSIPEFNYDERAFAQIWQLHPEEYHYVKMYGKEVPTPRWQQSYGKNYSYSGSKNNARPIPSDFQIFLDWSRENIDPRLNGLLLNWYDGSQGHYIGAHRDDTRDLHPNSPIVTISLGQERIFRMRKYKHKGYQDIKMGPGAVIVIPWQTNLEWTHEVPHFKKYAGRRVSVTLRAYL